MRGAKLTPTYLYRRIVAKANFIDDTMIRDKEIVIVRFVPDLIRASEIQLYQI